MTVTRVLGRRTRLLTGCLLEAISTRGPGPPGAHPSSEYPGLGPVTSGGSGRGVALCLVHFLQAHRRHRMCL